MSHSVILNVDREHGDQPVLITYEYSPGEPPVGFGPLATPGADPHIGILSTSHPLTHHEHDRAIQAVWHDVLKRIKEGKWK